MIAAGNAFADKRRAVSSVLPVTLRVETSLDGLPAGNGVFVEVDGRRMGITAAGGVLVTQVGPGAHTVRAFLPGLAEGTATVTAISGKPATVSVSLTDAEAVEESVLVVEQAPSLILPRSFQSLSLRVENRGRIVPLRQLDAVELTSAFASELGLAPIDVRPLFTLQASGRLTIPTPQLAAFRDALDTLPQGPVTLSVTAADSDGVLYAAQSEFSFGRHQLTVTLTPPSSKPNLVLAQRVVQVTVLNTPIDLRVPTDSHGRFTTLLPAGSAALNLEIHDGGRYYYAQTHLTIDHDVVATVPVLSIADLQLGTSSTYVGGPATNARPDRMAPRGPSPRTDAASCNATATARTENERVTSTVRVPVQKGTKAVTLQYTVQSAEYPYYVKTQSIYDDVWELRVFASGSGKNLFSLIRQVNSQLTSEPVWQSDGTTGTIARELDVSALTKDAAAELTIFVAATNIGDSQLETSVCASIGPGSELSIESVKPTALSNAYSIPDRGKTNTLARNFDVRVLPDANAVKRVKVELLSSDGSVLGEPVLDGPVSLVQKIDEKTLRIPVTMTSPSTVGAPPPQATRIAYRFTVSADAAMASRESSVFKALWKWPGDRLGIGRYSTRDGGDDWTSRGAYQWIEDNVAFLKTTYVNDISGEHGRDIGHKEHKRGTDLDLFHFTVLAPGLHATSNYNALRTKVLAAMDGNATAKAEVTTFFTTARARLEQVLAMSDVRVVYFGIGDSVKRTTGASLPSGWMRSLLISGTVTANDKELLDLGTAWAGYSASMNLRFNSIHNNHVHVGLNEAVIDP